MTFAGNVVSLLRFCDCLLRYLGRGTPVIEIAYDSKAGMAFPSYFFTFADRLGLPYWIIMAKGSYGGPITIDLDKGMALIKKVYDKYQIAEWGK